MPVELQNASAQAGLPDAACVSQWVALALSSEKDAQVRDADLCVRFVDADEGAQLNLQYRHIDKATNVLSFPADMMPNDNLPLLLGDLVLCSPVVAQEALEQGKSLTDHAAHLVVHGVLHLLGYDHETDPEAQAMESLEISLLAQLGIANPYVQVTERKSDPALGPLQKQVSS